MAEVWQENRAFEKTNEHMLNDNVLFDVTFLVGTNKEEVKAHKFMLASRSPVFYAMFCGPMSETSNTIEIPDIERETMITFLRFIYTEDCEVNGETVMALWYAAKKYSIKRLQQKCQAFVSEQISYENVCTIFAQSHMLSELELKQNCFNFITTNGKQVLQTEGFRQLPKELLKEILESDDTNAAEEDIYDSCKQWATFQLRNADESRDSHSEIRNILGDLLYLVRFPTMSIEAFTTKCSHDDILSADEKVSIVQYIVIGSKGKQFKFCEKARPYFSPKVITRFTRVHGINTGWTNGMPDAIDFVVSRTATILGIGVYSPCNSGTVKGVVSLMRGDKSVIVEKVVEITYSPSKYHEEVLFEKGVLLEVDNKYTIKVVLNGQNTFFDITGQKEVTEGDLSVIFSNSDIGQNGTDISNGQIPFLILGF